MSGREAYPSSPELWILSTALTRAFSIQIIILNLIAFHKEKVFLESYFTKSLQPPFTLYEFIIFEVKIHPA